MKIQLAVENGVVGVHTGFELVVEVTVGELHTPSVGEQVTLREDEAVLEWGEAEDGLLRSDQSCGTS